VLAACDALLGHEPDRPEGGDAAAVVPDATPADLDAASPGLDASAIVDASSPGDASAVDATAIDASVAEADAAAFVPDIGPVDAGCPAHSYPCTSGCCTKLLAAGGDHGCASNAQGEVFCWGAWGSAEKSSGPTKILGVSNAAALAAGGAFSCAIDQGKNLSCWGFNQWGELGIGNWTMDPVWTATRVDQLGATLAAGAGMDHACAVTDDLALHCWGMNTFGQLGLGDSTGFQVSPQDVSVAGKHVLGVAGGWKTSCAVISGGAVYCWGNDTLGELADPTMTAHFTPYAVSSMETGVSAIACGSLHACGVKNGAVYCWGNNDHLEVVKDGNSCSKDTQACYAVNAVGLTGVEDVTAGDTHSCALLTDGTVRCWGSNASGQIGNDSADTGDVFPPAQVSGLTGVDRIAAGLNHTCAARQDEVWCWGANDQGQLGLAPGTPAESRKPMLVTY
jgi:alpha-tubulin suppressor-like RCC1 family protein